MHFAHSTADRDPINWQPLSAHLQSVSELTAIRAAKLGASRLGSLTGLLHDLGKYSNEFQAYISGQGPSPDHSTAGAQQVMQMVTAGRDAVAMELAAYCIAGHHAGLPDREGGPGSLSDRLKKKTLPQLDPIWWSDLSPSSNDIFPADFKWIAGNKQLQSFQLSMLGRMLFSSLVDADFVDTERFYAADRGELVDREWAPLAGIVETLIVRFNVYMAEKKSKASDTPINTLRSDILSHVRSKAGLPKGVFTLSVPTGGGKTLASLGFALEHAKVHRVDRIVYGIPFTSIIDQTAGIFREVLGDGIVLEHHSAIEQEESERAHEGERYVKDKMRLAMEDWNAPVVVATNVQLFESLFSNRTSRCRKLHNLANAIIVLDEAQTIPLPLLRPCVIALDELARNYGCTIVLCTATQPALQAPLFRNGFNLSADRELAPEPLLLHRDLRRTTQRLRGEMTDQALVDDFKPHPQVLVIVNSRKHALMLYRTAQASGLKGLIHLTTRQTAADRRRILGAIRQNLRDGMACCVIATSLVEAGVDLDFPRVWRAEAGLEQIAQAAGRCNREGKRRIDESIVTIFKPTEARPPAEIAGLIGDTGRILKGHIDDLFSPKAIAAYFGEVYWRKGEGGLDAIRVKNADGQTIDVSVLEQFSVGSGQTDFGYRTVAEGFRFIQSGMVPVIIGIEEDAKAALYALRSGQLKPGAAARRLQNYIVQVPPRDRRKLIDNGHVFFVDAEMQFAVLNAESFYTREVGLMWEEADRLREEDYRIVRRQII